MAAVDVVGVVAAVVASGLADWTKWEQIASLVSLDPYPCPSLAFGSSGSFAGPGPLLQKNKKQRKGVRLRHLDTYSLTQDEGFCETPLWSDASVSVTCSEVPKPWSAGGNGSNSGCSAHY